MDRKNLILVISLIQLLGMPSLFAMQQGGSSSESLDQRFQRVEYESNQIQTLINGIYKGVDIDSLFFQLDPRVSINTRDFADHTVLTRVVRDSHKIPNILTVLPKLLSRGADINAEWLSGQVPLHLAVKKGDEKVASILIKAGANINARDHEGAPLHHAVMASNFSMVELLLENGADINAGDVEGKTPLHYAVGRHNSSMLTVLIKKNANAGAGDCEGNTPLHYSAESFMDEEVMKILLNAGADVNAGNKEGNRPLHLAAKCASKEVIQMFLDAGANGNAENEEGKTPFDLAATGEKGRNSFGIEFSQPRDPEIFKLLLTHENGVSLSPDTKEYYFNLAERQSRMEHVAYMIKEYGNQDQEKQETDASVKQEQQREIDKLEKAGPENQEGGPSERAISDSSEQAGLQGDNQLPQSGMSIVEAIRGGNVGAIKECLRDPDIDINGLYNNGEPLLHFIINQHLGQDVKCEMICMLLDKEPGLVNKADECGATPLHYAAAQSGSEGMAPVLIAAGANVNATCEHCITPLHLAVISQSGSEGMVRALIDAGSDVNAVNEQGATPLHLAVLNGQANMVPVLIAAGANVNAVNEQGTTPLDLAVENGKINMEQVLRNAKRKAAVRGLLNLIMKPLRLAKQSSVSFLSNLVGGLQKNIFAKKIIGWLGSMKNWKFFHRSGQ